MHTEIAARPGAPSATTAAALLELTGRIAELVENAGIDTRFGEKLLRSAREEAALVQPGEANAPEDDSLSSALDRLAAVLTQREGNLLVAANDRLRDAD